MGTVPMGMGESAMMALRMAGWLLSWHSSIFR
jgi:hypothetical protein